MKETDRLVMEHIERHRLLQYGDRVLVAVSGGPDSMLLLDWLHRFKERWSLHLHAAHLHHGLRGEEADEDENTVRSFCEKRHIPYAVGRVDVAEWAEEHGQGIQEAARECRYRFLSDTARKEYLNKLAVAHHADDQVETVLMRLIRGAGLGGLSGMPVSRKEHGYELIRPFLIVSKAEIERYCRKEGLYVRRDSSNQDETYTRNYIRRRIMPSIRKLNPNVTRSVYDMTRVLQDEERYMHRQAREAAKEVTEYRADRQVIVNLEKFRHLDNPLQRRVILILLNYLPTGCGAWQSIHIDDVLQLVCGEGGFKRLTLPFQTGVKRVYDRLHIEQQDGNRQDAGQRGAGEPCPASGKRTDEDLAKQVQKACIIWGAGEYVWLQKKICVQLWEDEQDIERIFREPEAADNTAYFDADALTWPLIVNTRQPGDRVQLFGMTGHKKVKGLFIDAKIPLPERAGWPLVREEEHILWIPQVARSDRAKITKHTKAIVSIEITPL